jgi:hypothetical protein
LSQTPDEHETSDDDVFRILTEGRGEARIMALLMLLSEGDPRLESFLRDELAKKTQEIDRTWLCALIDAVEQIEIQQAEIETEITTSMWEHARNMRDSLDVIIEHAFWSAIRIFASGIPAEDALKLLTFLRPEDQSYTRQVTLQSLCHIFEVDDLPAEAKALTDRVQTLADKYLDPDWLISPENNVLAMNAFCAAAVMGVPKLKALTKKLIKLDRRRLISQVHRQLSQSLPRAKNQPRPWLERCISLLKQEL